MIASSTASDVAAEPTQNASDMPAKSSKKKGPLSDRLAKTFEDAVARGDDAWRGGNADMAVYFYVQALSFKSRDFDTLCKIGAIEQKRDKPDLAARAFELAAEARPSDPRVTARLGLLYTEQADQDKAEIWLKRSVESGSDSWHVFDTLGVIEGHKGNSQDALEYLQQARSLAPAETAPLLHAAQVQFAGGDFNAAEASLRGVISRRADPEAQELLGRILAKRRAYPEAVDSLLRVLDPSKAYDLVAQQALTNGDNEAALRYFEQAATLSPTYYADAHRDAALARERLDASR